MTQQVVIGVTGSIACYKACDLVSLLRKEISLSVQVVMTQEATRFVSPMTFQALSGTKVYSDLFECPEEWDLLHTSLSGQTDLVAVYPATTNVIGKLANGICDDLLTCLVFATKAPVILAPAMNKAMYEHPVTQQNMASLKRVGYQFVGPVEGTLACRQVGMGHVAEVEEMAKAIQQGLKRKK